MIVNLFRVRGDSIPANLINWRCSFYQWGDGFAIPLDGMVYSESCKKVPVEELVSLLRQGKNPQYGADSIKIKLSREVKNFLDEVGIEVQVVRLGKLSHSEQFGIETVSGDKQLGVLASYGCKIERVRREQNEFFD